jgi:hypothetical protein
MIKSLLINIYNPISSLETTTTVSLLKNLFLSYISNSYIIELSPFLVEMILDEGIVMATICISIMNTNSMYVIWIVSHTLISLFFLLIELINLGFKLFYLALSRIGVLIKNPNYG